MDKSIWQKVYDILVREGGASDDPIYRLQFEQYQMTCNLSGNPNEWRFQGALGFGGKFRRDSRDSRWYVNCYIEDLTEERETIIKRINEQLAALHDSK